MTQRIFDDALAVFEGSGIEVDVRDADGPLEPRVLRATLRDYDGVVCLLTDRLDRSVLEANPHLRVVANVAVGYDNIDVATAHRLGIVVTNTPDVLTETTADLTVALLLAVARRIPEGDRFVRSGRWERWRLLEEQTGVDVHGKTLGVFGMGRIGRAVARRVAHGFGMRVLYHSRRPLPEPEAAALGARAVGFEELLASSDFLSLHAPLTAETRHVIGAAELARMRDDAFLVNTARGALVDEQALAAALRDGTIAGAGLDVFEDEPAVHPGLLARQERVVLLPHLGSATIETRRRMAAVAATNARAVLLGAAPPNPVMIL